MSVAPALKHLPPDGEAAGLLELEVPLPTDLQRFGGSVRASLVGRQGAPLLVLLGGISGNRHPCRRPDGSAGWWSGLAGIADPARHRILGIDFAADESGRCAPSTQDQSRVVAAALDAANVARAEAVIGASYGGMIALALAERQPERVERIVIISADAEPHPMSTATRELQRRVVRLGLDAGRGAEALAIARGMGMLTYRSPTEFGERFVGGIAADDPLACSAPGAYLRARGTAFCDVMTPQRFLSLSASIDRHRVDPERIATPALLIGAESDQLVPPARMRSLAGALGGLARLHLLPSLYGHDMFLKEAGLVSRLIEPFLEDEG